MMWTFSRSIGLLTLLLTTTSIFSGWFTVGLDSETRQTISEVTKAASSVGKATSSLGNEISSIRQSFPRKLNALAYTITGLYLIGSNKVSDEKDQHRYSKESFACQLAIGLSLAGFGYYASR